MSKSDQGYRRASAPTGGGGGGRGKTIETYLAQISKERAKDLYLRTATEGILDLLGLLPNSDMAVEIRRGLLDEYENGGNMTKSDLFSAAHDIAKGMQALDADEGKVKRLQESDLLIAALQSATRTKDRENLDEGDYLDDPVSLLSDGVGWGDEQVGAHQYQKHTNLCIDNSGSTHTPQTGFCSKAMSEVFSNLSDTLFEASSRWPRITWDVFSFNRITKQHTGARAKRDRYDMMASQMWFGSHLYYTSATPEDFVVNDPLHEDATETNLAPLIEALYENEAERGLIGQPRLDIILTDGEFESQEDADAAAEWQRRRGSGVTTYVVNLCPDVQSEIRLPHQFRVIPLHCIEGPELFKTVDGAALRSTLMRIVLEEAQKGGE